jgi:TusA-related sulfurtransferase
MMEARQLDLTGAEQECGDSAMGRVRRAYAGLAPGERLEVVTGVAEQVFGIRAWSRRVGGEGLEESREPGSTRLVLRRPAASAS